VGCLVCLWHLRFLYRMHGCVTDIIREPALRKQCGPW
jgi:hypothetical protein